MAGLGKEPTRTTVTTTVGPNVGPQGIDRGTQGGGVFEHPELHTAPETRSAMPAEAPQAAEPRSLSALMHPSSATKARVAGNIPGGIGGGDGGERGRKGVEKPPEDKSAIAKAAQMLSHKPGGITALEEVKAGPEVAIFSFNAIETAVQAAKRLQEQGECVLQINEITHGNYQVAVLAKDTSSFKVGELGEIGHYRVNREVYFNGAGLYGEGVKTLSAQPMAGKRTVTPILPVDDQYTQERKQGIEATTLSANLATRERARQKSSELVPHFQKTNPATRVEELKDQEEYFCAIITLTPEKGRTGRDQKEIAELAVRHGLIVLPMIEGQPITIIEPSERGGTLALFAQTLSTLAINRTTGESPKARMKIAITQGTIDIMGEEQKTVLPNGTTRSLQSLLKSTKEGQIRISGNARQLIQERDTNVKLVAEVEADGSAIITRVESASFLERARPKVYVPTALRKDIGTFLYSGEKTLRVVGEAGSGKSATVAEALSEFQRENEGQVIILSASGVDKTDLGELRMYARSLISGLLPFSTSESWAKIKEQIATPLRYIIDFHNKNQKEDYELDLQTLGTAFDEIEQNLRNFGIETVKVGDDIRRFGDEAYSWFLERANKSRGQVIYTHRNLKEREGRDVDSEKTLQAEPLLIIDKDGQPAPMVTQWIATVYNNGTISEGSGQYASTASEEFIKYLCEVTNGNAEDNGMRVNPLRMVRATRAARNLEVAKTDKTGIVKIDPEQAESKREEVRQAANLSEITAREFANIMGKPSGENPSAILALEGLNANSLQDLIKAMESAEKGLENLSLDIIDQCVAVGIIEVDNGELVVNARWKDLLKAEAENQSMSASNAKKLLDALERIHVITEAEEADADFGQRESVNPITLYRLAEIANDHHGKKAYLIPAARICIERGDHRGAIDLITKTRTPLEGEQKRESNFLLAQACAFAGIELEKAKGYLNAALTTADFRDEAARTLLQLEATSTLLERKKGLPDFQKTLERISQNEDLQQTVGREIYLYQAIHEFLSGLEAKNIPSSTLNQVAEKLDAFIKVFEPQIETLKDQPREKNRILSLLAMAYSTQQRVQSELARKSGETDLDEESIRAAIKTDQNGANAEACRKARSYGDKAVQYGARARGFNTGGKLSAQTTANNLRATLFLGGNGQLERGIAQAEAQLNACNDKALTGFLGSQLSPPALVLIEEFRSGATPDAEGNLERLSGFYFAQCDASYEVVKASVEGAKAKGRFLQEAELSGAYNYIERLLNEAKWKSEEGLTIQEQRTSTSEQGATRRAISEVVDDPSRTPQSLAKEANRIFTLMEEKLDENTQAKYRGALQALRTAIGRAL